MNEEGVKKLAELSRLELADKEVTEYTEEFSEILDYINSLKDATAKMNDDELILENASNRNVLREDENPHDSGINTKKIVDSAPEKENDYIKVKKVL